MIGGAGIFVKGFIPRGPADGPGARPEGHCLTSAFTHRHRRLKQTTNPGASATAAKAATGPALPGPPFWLLVLMTFSGTLAMHMFVPALSSAARALATTPAAIQATITLYVLGMAIGQLVYGPLSDRFGRRPVILGGLTLYALSSVACMLALDVQLLVAARFAQALGGCSGFMLARAIIRDTSDAGDTVRKVSTLSVITMMGPALGPLIGGLLVSLFNWRAIFVFFVVMGAVTLGLTWRCLPETHIGRTTTNARALAAEYASLLKSPVFVGYVIGGGCTSTSFYAFIASAPFIFIDQLHQPVQTVGLCLFLLMSGLAIGNIVARSLGGSGRHHILMTWGSALSLLAAVFIMGMALTFGIGTVGLIAAMVVYGLGIGICNPVAAARSISVNPRVAGSASGLYGFVQMSIGALCTTLAGFGRDHVLTAAAIMAGGGVITQVAFRVSVVSAQRTEAGTAER